MGGGASTFEHLGLPLFELIQVLRILPEVGCRLVLGELSVISRFRGIGLTFKNLFVARRDSLPVLPNQFGNLRKGKVLTLQIISHF